MPKKRNGYDRYLDFQFREIGDFFRFLFEAISRADDKNTEKLRLGFPEEVDAVCTWQRVGLEALLEKCSLGNPQIERMRSEF